MVDRLSAHRHCLPKPLLPFVSAPFWRTRSCNDTLFTHNTFAVLILKGWVPMCPVGYLKWSRSHNIPRDDQRVDHSRDSECDCSELVSSLQSLTSHDCDSSMSWHLMSSTTSESWVPEKRLNAKPYTTDQEVIDVVISEPHLHVSSMQHNW